jgi:hypothetical protein
MIPRNKPEMSAHEEMMAKLNAAEDEEKIAEDLVHHTHHSSSSRRDITLA